MTGIKRLLMELPDLPLASCKASEDADLFMATDYEIAEHIEELREICGSCPEVAKCLRYALEKPESLGFWGGKSAKERRAIARKRKVAKGRTSRIEERGALIVEFREKGATYKEIANHLGISEASAVQTAVRYRKRMKEAM